MYSFIVCTGSRKMSLSQDRKLVLSALQKEIQSTEEIFVHGGAFGLDSIVENVCQSLGYNRIVCPANWEQHDKEAGMIRNQFMLEFFKPRLVIAFPRESSVGTIHCMEMAKALGIPLVEY